MGIFSDNVVRLYEQGIYTIPCGDKKQPLLGNNWQRYCDIKPTENEVERWESEYIDCQRLGLLLGEVTEVVGFDLDYAFVANKMKLSEQEFYKDRDKIYKQIKALLPQTPCHKVGKIGGTFIYRYHPSLKNINVLADRNGVRLFDFLNWHKQTIIPPSLHSIDSEGKAIMYNWKGIPLEECIEDLPEITLDVILEIKELFKDTGSSVLPSRHKKLLDYALALSKIEKDESLIAKKLIEKDKIINQPSYLDDKKHHATDDADKNASNWVRRIMRWKDASHSDKDSVSKNLSEDSWDYFFDQQFHKVKKDIVTDTVYVKKTPVSRWEPAVNFDSILKAEAIEKKLSMSHVTPNLDRWIYNKNNPELLCDIPEWDGVDRIAKIAGCIVADSIFTSDDIINIFKHWGVVMYAKIFNHTIQNRTLILKGDQGMGKDSLITSIFGGLTPSYRKSSLSGSEIDVWAVVARAAIVHIEEFDQTSRHSVAFLKNVMTTDSIFFRSPYERAPREHLNQCSIISTSNDDAILRDSTGNRRYIVLTVQSVRHEYPRDESLMCLAQVKSLYHAGLFLRLNDELEAKIKVIIDEYTPEDMALTVVDRYRFLMGEYHPSNVYNAKKHFSSGEIMTVLSQVAKEASWTVRNVQRALKSHKYSKRTRHGIRYYRVPHDWIHLNEDGVPLDT